MSKAKASTKTQSTEVVATSVQEETLYSLLGANKHASLAEIKEAYRRTARETHPDMGGDADDFKKVSEAYSVLSDPTKREEYDLTGKASVQPDQSGKEVVELLQHILRQVIQSAESRGQNPARINLVEAVREGVKKVISEHIQHQEYLDFSIASNREIRRRLYLLDVGEGGDFFGALLDDTAQNMETVKKDAGRRQGVAVAALARLDNIGFTTDDSGQLPLGTWSLA